MTPRPANPLPLPPTTAIVLAGGAGRRMGGRDKGLLPFRAGFLIEPVLAVLAPQVDELIISANRHLSDYRAFGFTVVSDPHAEDRAAPEYAGPVAALRHCGNEASHDWLLLAPCDMPGYRPHWPARLWETQRTSRAAVVIAHDGDRLQPTVALIHRPCLAQRPDPNPDKRLDPPPPTNPRKQGQRLADLLMAGRYALCDLSADRACFANINTPEDLEALPDPRCAIPEISRTRR